MTEKFGAKNKLFLLTWERLLIGCQGNLFSLRRKGVREYLVDEVIYFYEGCKTAVSVDGKLSSSFSVRVGVHEGSALSPSHFYLSR